MFAKVSVWWIDDLVGDSMRSQLGLRREIVWERRVEETALVI